MCPSWSIQSLAEGGSCPDSFGSGQFEYPEADSYEQGDRIYKEPAGADKAVAFTVQRLPEGWHMDPYTGIFSGEAREVSVEKIIVTAWFEDDSSMNSEFTVEIVQRPQRPRVQSTAQASIGSQDKEEASGQLKSKRNKKRTRRRPAHKCAQFTR